MKNILQQINWREVGQIVLQGLITLAVLTYLSGWYLGRWLHRANDQLARLWVQLTVPDELLHLEQVAKPQSQTDLRQLAKATAAPMQHPEVEGLVSNVRFPDDCAGSTEASTPAAAPMQHPLAQLADALATTHTAAQLRQLTGCRRKLAKPQLVALALAC